MRAAFITPYFLWPPDTGGKLRSYYLLKGLAEIADVDFYTVSYDEPPNPAPLRRICRTVQIVRLQPRPHRREQLTAIFASMPRSVRYFHSAESLTALRNALESQPYDLLVCDEICMAPYLDELSAHIHTPRLVTRQKVDHLHYYETGDYRPWGREKLLDLLEARRLKHFEESKMPNFQAAVVCSVEDGEIIRKQGRDLPVSVIVNGADVDYFTPQRLPDAAPTVLLLGTMHYYPNIDAVLYFFQTFYPMLRAAIPGLQVLIVGHSPPLEIEQLGALPGVTVTGSVPDVRPYMARSWIMAVPLRLGGGTRLKIVESMAAGLPVVSTTVGAQGLDVRDGVDLMLADDPQEFVRKCVQLLCDPDLRQRLAVSGRALAEQKYSWQRMGERFAEFCYTVAGVDPCADRIAAQSRRFPHPGDDEELAFWDEYLARRGDACGIDFQLRCDPDLRLQSQITNFVAAPPDATVEVLDVGAGPLTSLGKRWGHRTVRITAIDPLAEEYDRLLAKHGVTPLVRTQAGDAERLTEQFADNSFDLVYAHKCIDRCADPLAAIQQMVAVAKPGGLVYMHHAVNQAEIQDYQGFQRWRLADDAGDLIAKGRSRSVNITELLSPIATIENKLLDNGAWMVNVIRKHSSAIHSVRSG